MKRPGRIGAGAIGAILGGAMSLSIQVVSFFEGTSLEAYPDPVGIPTICTGHTGPTVKLHQTKTPEECEALLQGDLGRAFDAIDARVAPDINRTLPPTRRAALASFIFNVGEGAFEQSTLLARLNAGQTKAACDQLSRWVYADGRKLAGLIRRRAAERELCLIGVER
ncbi:lysozyme [Larsenimonas suaedae]|uniref:Lysozyme n=1 Tax=Larsenimonas suaedae TaxID=1851019 RepID=A0ABU1GYJ2_9GAMM|nr:lysozyme [Larsenimonas suaedae]MCM2973505.1 lysozyme [Larsenimonas suaedae]MDR5897125.1 lysozyme [Larsenimonas suaedae]